MLNRETPRGDDDRGAFCVGARAAGAIRRGRGRLSGPFCRGRHAATATAPATAPAAAAATAPAPPPAKRPWPRQNGPGPGMRLRPRHAATAPACGYGPGMRLRPRHAATATAPACGYGYGRMRHRPRQNGPGPGMRLRPRHAATAPPCAMMIGEAEPAPPSRFNPCAGPRRASLLRGPAASTAPCPAPGR